MSNGGVPGRQVRGAPAISPEDRRLSATHPEVGELAGAVLCLVDQTFTDRGRWSGLVGRLTRPERERLGGGTDLRLRKYLSAQFASRAVVYGRGPNAVTILIVLAHCVVDGDRVEVFGRLERLYKAVHGDTARLVDDGRVAGFRGICQPDAAPDPQSDLQRQLATVDAARLAAEAESARKDQTIDQLLRENDRLREHSVVLDPQSRRVLFAGHEMGVLVARGRARPVPWAPVEFEHDYKPRHLLEPEDRTADAQRRSAPNQSERARSRSRQHRDQLAASDGLTVAPGEGPTDAIGRNISQTFRSPSWHGVNQVLGGRYRLVERLGTGGMSVVWRAYDEVLDRQVAVKMLAAGLTADPRSWQMLRAEAQAAARLSHPNVTGVYDYGESMVAGERVPYVVMELISGPTLAERLDTGSLPWQEALRIGAEVAAALAEAHASGLVHCDVKPTNVMLTAVGAKVVDFGIAAAVGACSKEGNEGPVFGTPAYLAPERFLGNPVRPANDVYALGILLYRSLTGMLPWCAESTTQIIVAHMYAEPEPMPAEVGIPKGVANLCLRCMAKNPEERPTAREVASVLAQAVGIRVMLPATAGLDDESSRSLVLAGNEMPADRWRTGRIRAAFDALVARMK